MNHARIEIEARLRHSLAPYVVVGVFVTGLGLLSAVGRAGRVGQPTGPDSIPWIRVILPAVFVGVVAMVDAIRHLARGRRTLVLDETGVSLEPRAGGGWTLPWTGLADRDPRVWASGWTLQADDGRRLTVSLDGFGKADRLALDSRIVDVLRNGPPLDPERKGRPLRSDPETHSSLMRGLIAGTAGAILGALGWGLLGWMTGLQVGYAAIGVGWLVGAFARSWGGRGRALTAGCIALALASILTGKAIGALLLVERRIEREQAAWDRARFDDYSAAAAEVAAGLPENRYAAFLLAHHWSGASGTGNVSDEEIRMLREVIIPDLRNWNRMPPHFEEWQESQRSRVRDRIRVGPAFTGYLLGSFGLLDVLFAAIAIGTVKRMTGEKKLPRVGKDMGLEAPFKAGARAGGGKVMFPAKRKGPPGGAAPAPPATTDPPPSSGPPPGTDPPAPRS